MDQDNRYDNLLALPLFQGMSRDDLHKAAGQTRFDFRKLPAKATIVTEGDPCKRLYFLFGGTVRVTTYSGDHEYELRETITPPFTFQPERLFGLHQQFTHTYATETPCSLLCITKKEALKLSTDFDIFRLNLLNLISTQSQKHNARLLSTPPKTLEQRIARFFASICVRQQGEKVLRIKMTRIADEINDSRLDASKALNRLDDRGLLHLHRAMIIIPDIEELVEKA